MPAFSVFLSYPPNGAASFGGAGHDAQEQIVGTRKPLTDAQRKQKRRGLVVLGVVLLAGGGVANGLFRGAYMAPATVSASMSADEQLAIIKKASAQSRSVRLEGRTAPAAYSGMDLVTSRRGVKSTERLYRVALADGLGFLCMGEVPDGDIMVLPVPAEDLGKTDETKRQLRAASGHGVMLRVQGAGARELRMAMLASPLVGGAGLIGYVIATRRRRERTEPGTGFGVVSAAG